jgi:hypothetical protein
LPLVLGILAALIGLGFLIRRVYKWIGGYVPSSDEISFTVWDDQVSDEQNEYMINYYNQHRARFVKDYWLRD